MIFLYTDIETPLAPKVKRERERNAVLNLINQYFGVDLELAHTSKGKPYLPEYPDIHISISHTKGRVGLALSQEPIGIDIEVLGSRVGSLIARIIPEANSRCIQNKPPLLRNKLEHLAWSASEALYKLVDESTVISDFVYKKRSLKVNQMTNTFELISFYRQNFRRPIYIKSYIFNDYIHTISSFTPIKNSSFLKI